MVEITCYIVVNISGHNGLGSEWTYPAIPCLTKSPGTIIAVSSMFENSTSSFAYLRIVSSKY